MKKWQILILAALISLVVISISLAGICSYVDNRFGPYRISQGLTKIMPLPAALIGGCFIMFVFFLYSEDAGKDYSRIVRAQSTGLLIAGLIVGLIVIMAFISQFIEGVQILDGTRPIKTGYQSEDHLMRAYERAYLTQNMGTFQKRIYSAYYWRKTSPVSFENMLKDMPRQRPVKFSWKLKSSPSKGQKTFTVVISNKANSTTKEIELSEGCSGWEVTDEQ